MPLKSIDYNSIRKIIRKTIIDSLHLNGNDNLKNAASLYGSDLSKQITVFETLSRDPNETFMIYEFRMTPGIDPLIINEPDGTVSSIQRYNFDLKIYGEHSHDMCQKIMALFKDPTILTELKDLHGIRVLGIPSPDFSNELINGRFWPKYNLTISIQVRHSNKLFEVETFGDIDDININIKIR